MNVVEEIGKNMIVLLTAQYTSFDDMLKLRMVFLFNVLVTNIRHTMWLINQAMSPRTAQALGSSSGRPTDRAEAGQKSSPSGTAFWVAAP